MTHFLYWPYDEVSLKTNATHSEMIVSTPWIEASVPLDDENRPILESLMKKFNDQSLSAQDIALVNLFFKELSAYPFCYIVPTAKDGENLDQHILVDERWTQASLSEFLEAALRMDDPADPAFSSEEIATVLSKLSRKDWDWDLASASAFARIKDQIHPESLFSVARRFHLIDILESNKARKNFDSIEELEGDDFAAAASLMVRQNHYVTQKCNESLLPALMKAGQAAPLVKSFIKEEDGHDRILHVAMKSFTDQPESVPVSLQTRALMRLLKFAAHRNFLGFAMVIDCFERSSYEESDPLAQLLSKGGFEKAAKQINRHMSINDAGGHENVACTFLAFMAPCEPSYALEALRLAEAVTLLMNSLTESTMELFAFMRPSGKGI